MSKELAVVVLAAGKGTRMRSKTIKILHPLAGIPLGAHPVHAVQELKPERIVMVIGHQAEEVKAALDARFPEQDLRYVIQEQQLGTAHALITALPELKDGPEQFFLIYGDVPLLTAQTMKQLQHLHHSQNAVVSFLSFVTDETTGYGRIVRNKDGDVQCIREHRDCSAEELQIKECNAGIYLFDSEFLFSNLRQIDSTNDQQEFYLTDIVEIAARHGRRVIAHIVDDPVEVMGVNDRTQLALLEERWQRDRKEKLMRDGVTFHLPSTTYLHYDVKIEQDAVIGPNCSLLGKTRIGNSSHVHANSHLTDVVIEADTHVPPHTVRSSKSE